MFKTRDNLTKPLPLAHVSSGAVLPTNVEMLRDLYYEEDDQSGLNSFEFRDDVDHAQHYTNRRDAEMISGIIKSAGGCPKEYETMIATCFSVTHTFTGSALYADPLYYPNNRERDSFYTPASDCFLYSTGTYMFIFPESGVRISGPTDFVNNLPYFDAIVSGRFKEKATTIPVVMSDRMVPVDGIDVRVVRKRSFVAGPTIYICHAPLEAVLYDAGVTEGSTIPVSLRTHVKRALGI
jgi:hypothetical protein